MTGIEITPDRETFRALTGYALVPVFRRVFVDVETPLGLYRKLSGGRRGSFLLESAEPGSGWSRYSIIGVGSPAMLTELGGRAVWLGEPPEPVADVSADPLMAAQDTVTALRHPPNLSPVPFAGGLVGYVGYDAVRRPAPRAGSEEPDLPAVALLLVTDVAVIDHADGSVLLVAGAYRGEGVDPDDAYNDAADRLEEMTAALATRLPPSVAVHDRGVVPPVSTGTPGEFAKQLARAQEHVHNGDCYLLTCSRRFEVPTTVTGLDAYRLIRATSAGPYLHLLDFGEFHVVGSSAMGQVKVAGGQVIVRPVAGARPRGGDPDDDTDRAAQLLGDVVARAEHVTLVDQARGDLARVCVPGTVRVPQFLEVERGRQTMQLASTVVGDVRSDRSGLEVFAATFPASALVGAPRVRATGLVEEVEEDRRGLYGGSIGYFGFGGDLEWAAMAGTAVIRDGRASVRSGAMVTVGTDLDEAERATREEAAAMLSALAVAETLEPPP